MTDLVREKIDKGEKAEKERYAYHKLAQRYKSTSLDRAIQKKEVRLMAHMYANNSVRFQ
jgi:hypothetical protein